MCTLRQVEWDLRADDPLEYSCVVEALMAAWVRGALPSPAPQATVPYAHQASPVMSAVTDQYICHVSDPPRRHSCDCHNPASSLVF